MPQLNNSDDAANDEPTRYNVEECEDDPRWNENLNDIKGALVDDLDRDTSRGGNTSKSDSHGESSNKSRLERDDPRDEAKGPGRPYPYPHDISSIVSGLPPSFFQNGGLPPNSKVPYPYNPYHLLYGAAGDDAKGGMSRGHHPEIPAMYPLPGQLGHIPHPLAPWPTAPIYPMCTASTIAPMLRYTNPFAAFTSAAAVAASNMSHFPRAPPGMHHTMIPHPAMVSNGPLGNLGGGQHPHHGKHDADKMGGRHSKSESEHGVGRAKRDRPYVKKPLNAFMLYMKEQRAKVVAECTLKESAAINQILGRKWHSLSREEQQKYYEMARKERQLHLQMYPGWSARDNYGKRKKRKKEKSQGECTAQNPKKCRAVFGLEQQQLWCAPCRRKKKCVRYQHDDDSDDDDLSPMGSPQQYQGFPGQGHPYDSIRSTSPLSMTSQSINISTNGNGEFNPATTSSSSRLHGDHPSPQMHPHAIRENHPDIKQEYRTSPSGLDGAHNNILNGNGFDKFNGRHPARTSSSENSFKSEGSPNSQGGDSNGGRGNSHHDNENNNNSNHKDQQRRPNFNRGNHGNNPPQNIIHRQSSVPPSGNDNRSSFRKTNSLDSSDMPGPSGLAGRRNSNLQSHNTSGNSNTSDGSPSSRSHHRSSFSKPSSGSSSSHMHPHPSPLHPQSGLYLPNQSGTSPILPVSPPYNHSPHASPFIPPYSPYLSSGMLAAFAPPASPLSSPLLSIFKGMSPSSLGGGMGVPNPGSSHGNQSRVTPGAVVEGKS
ncbi:uncharacterized protein LOC120328830 [Styela clava]